MFGRKTTRIAELTARIGRLVDERDDARATARERLATITRLARQNDDLCQAPAETIALLRGLLRTARESYAALEEQLLTVQAANEAMAAELADRATAPRGAVA